MTRFGGSFRTRPKEVVFGSSREKLLATKAEFEGYFAATTAVCVLEAESATHYRQRCRFSMRGRFGGSGDEALNYSMFDGEEAASVQEFSLASARINGLMPEVLWELRRKAALGSNELRAVHLHAPRRVASATVVSLVYGAPIQDEAAWHREAVEARREVKSRGHGDAHLIGRCKGRVLVSDESAVLEELVIEDEATRTQRRLLLEFPDGSFSHPNTRANERSVAWLRERAAAICADRIDARLLELFCGAGNHTICLCESFASATAVEIDAKLVDAAARNLGRNRLEGRATFIAADAERFCARLLRRAKRDPADFQFDAVLVDPPRRGLDRKTLDLLHYAPHVLYVSCNPVALRADLDDLCRTHHIAAFALLDAFPSTPHLECLVHLVRTCEAASHTENNYDDDGRRTSSERSSSSHGGGASNLAAGDYYCNLS